VTSHLSHLSPPPRELPLLVLIASSSPGNPLDSYASQHNTVLLTSSSPHLIASHRIAIVQQSSLGAPTCNHHGVLLLRSVCSSPLRIVGFHIASSRCVPTPLSCSCIQTVTGGWLLCLMGFAVWWVLASVGDE
jgi:hypothetical protein